jgi:sulfate permease, SulP family
MRRMAEISGARVVENGGGERVPLPPGVVLYRIAGPLFFGAADKAIGAITTTGSAQVLMLDMQAVPAMDATGLVALESLLKRLAGSGILVQIIGLQDQPRGVLRKAGIEERPGVLTFHPTLENALLIARLVP